MDFNRYQCFMAGLVVFLLGIQLRMVEAFVLNERATQFLAQRMQEIKGNQVASAGDLPTLFAAQSPLAKKRLEPPKWIGWAMVSVGSVLILQSLVMKKPGG
jgi:protein-S-isoprenylcysteine O-methyltransferase Ste14